MYLGNGTQLIFIRKLTLHLCRFILRIHSPTRTGNFPLPCKLLLLVLVSPLTNSKCGTTSINAPFITWGMECACSGQQKLLNVHFYCEKFISWTKQGLRHPLTQGLPPQKKSTLTHLLSISNAFQNGMSCYGSTNGHREDVFQIHFLIGGLRMRSNEKVA